MRGCLTVLMMWLPILIAKLLKGIWAVYRFLLGAVCGVPLYYSRPLHRILGQMVGFFGLLSAGAGAASLLIMVFDLQHAQRSVFGGGGEMIRSALISLAVGVAALFACRLIIRRGTLS